ncbi:MAG TPA: RDD family protein [Mycobacteriales bacterium]|nr:RDD family protein [Mycobacteriales bacterium]
MTQPYDPNQPPPYGAPPPPPPAYGAPPPGAYGTPPPGYGTPPPGYGAPPPQYGGPAYGGGYGPPPGQRVNDPAPMGMRLLARIIDAILTSVIATVVSYAIGMHPFQTSTSADGTHTASFQLYNGDYFKFALITLIVTGIYEVAMLVTRGATLGKMAVGVRVAKLEDGTNPDVQAALVRWAIPGAAQALIPFLGWVIWLSPFFDSSHRNRGWYDYAAKTIAVRTK